MSDVKLPTRKKLVDLPERPKDRNAQTRERFQEKVAAAATPSGSLEQIKIQKELESKVVDMDGYQRDCLKAYAEAATLATKQLAMAKYGPAGSMEMGAAEIDKLMLDMTDLLLSSSKGKFGMNEFFAMLGATGGYQAGIAMSVNDTVMTEGMIKTAVMIFEGGFRLISESAKIAHRNQKVIRPASRILQ